jgi:hypothetical protein
VQRRNIGIAIRQAELNAPSPERILPLVIIQTSSSWLYDWKSTPAGYRTKSNPIDMPAET